MNAVAETTTPFVFTDSAAGKVKELIEEEGNPSLKLRVFVTGGGCSGFQYGFTFDEEVNEDDTTMEKNGVTLLLTTAKVWKARSSLFGIRTQLLPVVAGHRSRLDVFFVKYRRREPPFLRLWNLYQAMDYAYLSAVNEMRRSFDQVARG